MNSLGDLLKTVPAANQSSIISKWLSLALSDAVVSAPHLTFTHFILEAIVSQVFTSQAHTIHNERRGLTTGVINKTFYQPRAG